jgi:hypothetical protein
MQSSSLVCLASFLCVSRAKASKSTLDQMVSITCSWYVQMCSCILTLFPSLGRLYAKLNWVRNIE